MTLSAAFHDSRFNPISDVELKDLTYEVTLLRTPYKIKLEDIYEKFITGKTGITIYFSDNTNATYLASVMIESFNMKPKEILTTKKFNEISQAF